jgi:hypothetical protein
MMTREGIVNEIHKSARRHYPRLATITKGLHDLWQADLVEMNSGHLKGVGKINQGYNYMLTVIDTFSKKAWAVPVKQKSGVHVTKAFESILKQTQLSPKYLQTDQGKEFYNSHFKQLMKKYNIKHYSTHTEMKASIVERFNTTLRNLMWKRFTLQGNYKWITILPQLLHEYNHTKHNTIKMKPADVTKKHESYLLSTVYCKKFNAKGKPKLKVGDYVRVSKVKKQFDRGFTPNWSTEISNQSSNISFKRY